MTSWYTGLGNIFQTLLLINQIISTLIIDSLHHRSAVMWLLMIRPRFFWWCAIPTRPAACRSDFRTLHAKFNQTTGAARECVSPWKYKVGMQRNTLAYCGPGNILILLPSPFSENAPFNKLIGQRSRPHCSFFLNSCRVEHDNKDWN